MEEDILDKWCVDWNVATYHRRSLWVAAAAAAVQKQVIHCGLSMCEYILHDSFRDSECLQLLRYTHILKGKRKDRLRTATLVVSEGIS